MKTDRELLEAAAKAAGIVLAWDMTDEHLPPMPFDASTGMYWNPITSVADRYELCKKLGLVICFKTNTIDSATQTACWTNDEDEGCVIVAFAGRVR